MTVRADSPFAKVFPSPNHGERKDGLTAGMIILHYTGMPKRRVGAEMAVQSGIERFLPLFRL
jgi:hypothetical protein